MKRIFFLLPRRVPPGQQTQDLAFSFELAKWLKERGIKDANIHIQPVDGDQKVQLYFDLEEQHAPALIRDYKERFLLENRERLEGQPEPEITAMTVEKY
ncbi:MAG: hypothetical protein V4509_05110 [Patescibacteria group bacterium]